MTHKPAAGNKAVNWILVSAMNFALLTLLLNPASGKGTVPLNAPQQSESPSTKVPHTAQEHLEMAESYKQKAIQYRREADEHRRMKEEYRKGVAQNPKGPENPWMVKMSNHCDRFIKQAEALAREADTFAQFHTLRAKEMQGK